MLISRSILGNKMFGNRIIRITTGRPRIVGVMNEANKFSFILYLKGFYVLRI